VNAWSQGEEMDSSRQLSANTSNTARNGAREV
jgi:hypothetical protein